MEGKVGPTDKQSRDIGLELQIWNQCNKKLMMVTLRQVWGSLRCRRNVIFFVIQPFICRYEWRTRASKRLSGLSKHSYSTRWSTLYSWSSRSLQCVVSQSLAGWRLGPPGFYLEILKWPRQVEHLLQNWGGFFPPKLFFHFHFSVWGKKLTNKCQNSLIFDSKARLWGVTSNWI